MADVPHHRLRPLHRDPLHRLLVKPIRAGHLLPDQQPQLVRPVQIPRIFDLLVLANPIESHRFRQFHVPPQRCVVRRRQPAVLPIPLVQRHPQCVRFPIQYEPVPQQRDRPQRRITFDPVHDLPPPVHQFHQRIDQLRPFWRPQKLVPIVIDPRIGYPDPPRNLRPVHRERIVREHPFPQRQPNSQPHPLFDRAFDPRLDADLPVVPVRHPPQPVNVRRRDHFHPHRLPDPRRSVIPDRVRLPPPILLPPRLGQILRIIKRPHHHVIRPATALHQFRDIGRERHIPPFVPHRQPIVHPNRCLIVHRPKVKQHPLPAGDLRHFHLSPIPNRLVEPAILHAAQRRLRRKRHIDLPIPLYFLRRPRPPRLIDRKLPLPIQIHPPLPLHLRPRIFMHAPLPRRILLLPVAHNHSCFSPHPTLASPPPPENAGFARARRRHESKSRSTSHSSPPRHSGGSERNWPLPAKRVGRGPSNDLAPVTRASNQW